MKRALRALLLVCVPTMLFGSGCATVVPIKVEQLPAPNNTTLVAIYAKSYFQERLVNIGKVVVLAVFHPPALGVTPTDFNADAEKMQKSRLESSAYERLLGDFDVLRCFATTFAEKTNGLRYLSVKLTDTDVQMRSVIDRAKAGQTSKGPLAQRHLDDTSAAYLALKFSYGMGPRQGKEQIGFVKKSRTYVRVVGVLKKTGTNEILWRNDLIVFGDHAYTSESGRPERLNTQELMASFKSITAQLADLLIQDLNAQPLPEKPILLITSSDDTQF